MKKKRGIYIAITVFIILIAAVSFGAFKHQEQVEAHKTGLKKEKSLEQNANIAVSQLFANKDEKILSDSYSQENASKAQKLTSELKNKQHKNELINSIKKAAKLHKRVQDSQKTVAALFKNEKKQELANNITQKTINNAKIQVEKHTPQKLVETKLSKDIKIAYTLLTKKPKDTETQGTVKESNQNKQAITSNDQKNSAKQSSGGREQNTAQNSTTQNNTKKSGNVSPSSTKEKNNANQPIVAKMNLASRTSQIITVVASGSTANVKFWQKSGSNWHQVFSTYGQVGSQGVGAADEYHSRTPRGAYSLGFAFGTSNPGTSLSFRHITNRSYWISNVKDPQYNTWQERHSSNKADEHMASYPTQYKYGVVINYNTTRVKGRGSGFFLHCSNGAATAGCVAIPTSNMRQVLQQLHPGAFIVNVTSERELLNY
ncbi:toxin Cry1Ac domain D-VI-related protein [Listeria sp. PSOL-1]|uniref:toxin Cry1Ac domain D-VI-related protein n=1 Tax=Listeria sp. PSOL-1 TaxID=1844999 RepID=UPI0013D836D3|nr:toxin Cry1Ac domain D-VI-related protein [Listeria sp. PSOL-1]